MVRSMLGFSFVVDVYFHTVKYEEQIIEFSLLNATPNGDNDVEVN